MFQVLLELFHNWRAKRRLKRWTENLRAKAKAAALLLVTVIPTSTNAQTISPVPDPVADAIYSEQLIFGDGWLSEWRASRAEARADREIIIKGIAELKGGLLDGFKGVGASIAAFMDKLISLVKWTVLLVGIGAVLYYTKMIRGFFVASVLAMCLVPVAIGQEPEDLKPNVVMYVPDFRCDACTTWQLNEMPKLVKEGVKVLIAKNTSLNRWPSFRVFKTDKWVKREAPMTAADYHKIVEGK